jgi:hypothetical protein
VTGEDVWYKMEKSSLKYEKYSAQMNNKVDNFLLLHDTLTKGNYEFVTTHPYTQLVSCKLTITEFHRRTNAAFDFKFVQENCEFVLDHLKNNLDPEKSLNFLLSIVSLGGIKRKLFLALFPSLKANYRKSDSKKNEVLLGKQHPLFDPSMLILILLGAWITAETIFVIFNTYNSASAFLYIISVH